MLMKAFVAKVKDDLSKINQEDIEQLDTFQSILNKIFLYNVELICNTHAKSVEEVVFDERNPFVKLLADYNEFNERVKASKIIKDNQIENPSPASTLAYSIARCLAIVSTSARATDLFAPIQSFLKPAVRQNVDLNAVPLLDMSVIAKLMLESIDKLPPEDTSIEASIYWASQRGDQEIKDFLQKEYGEDKRVAIKSDELTKCIYNVLIKYGNAVEGSVANSNPHTRANRERRLFAHYIVLADVVAKLNYRDHEVDKLLQYKAHNDGQEGANIRLLDFIADSQAYKDIDLSSKVNLLKRKHSYARYDLAQVNELLTDNDVHNRLLLFKLFRTYYVADRKKHLGFGLWADKTKLPAAHWAINYLMGKTDLHNFERDIPEKFKAAFAEGELANFKLCVIEAGKKFVPEASVGLTLKNDSVRVGL